MTNKKFNLKLTLTCITLLSVSFLVFNCEYKPYNQGKNLYVYHCANCHMENGKGLRELFPPIDNSDWLKQNQDKLACPIRKGVNGTIVVNQKTYSQDMPGNLDLTEAEINNIINYINHAWNNNYSDVNIPQTITQLTQCDGLK